MHELFRSQLIEFGEKILGLEPNHIINTPAFDLEFQEAAADVDNLFKARVLAYSSSMRKTHSSGIYFLLFC